MIGRTLLTPSRWSLNHSSILISGSDGRQVEPRTTSPPLSGMLELGTVEWSYYQLFPSTRAVLICPDFTVAGVIDEVYKAKQGEVDVHWPITRALIN